ncbi:MAG: helix-turn-helix domain-containing protein [Candidatus Omnitrophica bacterium]|nr:helix-turn-helix domain-containing protein [Candidatus Omnitrophota bacterium]
MEKELQEWYKLHKFYFYTNSYQTKDLARYLGVSTRTIQRWLKEKTKPGEEQLKLIKRYLEKQKSDQSGLE